MLAETLNFDTRSTHGAKGLGRVKPHTRKWTTRVEKIIVSSGVLFGMLLSASLFLHLQNEKQTSMMNSISSSPYAYFMFSRLYLDQTLLHKINALYKLVSSARFRFHFCSRRTSLFRHSFGRRLGLFTNLPKSGLRTQRISTLTWPTLHRFVFWRQPFDGEEVHAQKRSKASLKEPEKNWKRKEPLAYVMWGVLQGTGLDPIIS